MAQKAWRCSQCGTVNESGARACRQCGRWPSLFDLQDSAIEEVEPAGPEARPTFEHEPSLDPESFEPAGPIDPKSFEPDVFEPEGDEAGKRRGRVPRWAITAIWVLGILVWIVVNALADRG